MDDGKKDWTTKQDREERRAEPDRVFTELQENERMARLEKTKRLRNLRLVNHGTAGSKH
jgi:hypothetical protein